VYGVAVQQAPQLTAKEHLMRGMFEMTIKLDAFIGLIVLVPVGINAQEGLTLTVDRLEYTSHNYIHQDISVKNDTSRLVRDVKVECGFFNEGELIATGFAYVTNIFPGTIGFRTVIESSDISPDRAECRIVLVQ